MIMKKSVPAESPDAYVKALTGWRKPLVQGLRKAVRAAGDLEEKIKWGHLVYSSGGPVLLAGTALLSSSTKISCFIGRTFSPGPQSVPKP